MEKRKILIQLDSDAQPSVFDRVVAVDAGADLVFSYGAVQAGQVRELVHGAIFTRGSKDLNHTAFFIGGSDVAASEKLLAEFSRLKHLTADGREFQVTFSAGVAMFQNRMDVTAWLTTADRALYTAKSSGRARVMMA